MPNLTLNILGAGTVGRVLARLFSEEQQFRVCQVLNTKLTSATVASHFIGQGEPLSDWSGLRQADAWMIGSVDSAIPKLADQLADSGLVKRDQLVFHLSGVRCADVFQRLQDLGAVAASLHPLKSFPDPELGYRSFGQTSCALEGDEAACRLLEPLLECIGARPFRLAAKQKVLYHAANTMLCNYLLGLLDAGLACYEQVGISSERALEMVAPLMQETLANGLSLGPGNALTGPLVRGDGETVRAHLDQLPEFAKEIYRSLGIHVLQMAQKSGRLTAAQTVVLEKIFRGSGRTQ